MQEKERIMTKMYGEEKEWVLAGSKKVDQLTSNKNRFHKHIQTPHGVDPACMIGVQDKDAYQRARSLL